jgi:ADP-heptose:LPS heptosyltransferase
VDFSKLSRTLPEAVPRWTATAGAEELARAFSAIQEASIEEAESKFSRLKQLQKLLSDELVTADLRWREE